MNYREQEVFSLNVKLARPGEEPDKRDMYQQSPARYLRGLA